MNLTIGTGARSHTSQSPTSRAERETETAAERLEVLIGDALANVRLLHSADEADELEACADRLERAARDLTVALRELAHRRRTSLDD